MTKRYTTQELRNSAISMLKERGVTLADIGNVVLELQKKYNPDLTIETCIYNVEQVLSKREALHAIITGISLDVMAENNMLPQPLQQIIEIDEPLYGIDEVLTFSIVNLYGSIGYTSFGYADKLKLGIIKELDEHPTMVHTFLDDIVGAIAAAAASRIAHQYRDKEESN